MSINDFDKLVSENTRRFVLFCITVYLWPIYFSIWNSGDLSIWYSFDFWPILYPLTWRPVLAIIMFFAAIASFAVTIGVLSKPEKEFSLVRSFAKNGFWYKLIILLLLPVVIILTMSLLDFLKNWGGFTLPMQLVLPSFLLIFLYVGIRWLQNNVFIHTNQDGLDAIGRVAILMALVFLLLFFAIRPVESSKHIEAVERAVRYDYTYPSQDTIKRIEEELSSAREDRVFFGASGIASTIDGADMPSCKESALNRYIVLTGHNIGVPFISLQNRLQSVEKCLSDNSTEFDSKALRLFYVVRWLCKNQMVSCN